MASKIIDWLNEDAVQPEPPAQEEVIRKSYDTKLVAWLDILGIRAKIKNEKEFDAEHIITIMSELASFVKTACDKYVASGKLTYLQIADGFMIVADVDLANELCVILAEVQWKILINLKMVSRGAITAGNVSIANDGNLIIGPAYVDAYVLESENAIFPRVIISQFFFNLTKSQLNFKHIRQDSDREKYIDFISYIIDEKEIDSKRLSQMLIQQGVLKELKEQHLSAFNKQKISLVQKYGWIMELLVRNNIQDI